MPRTTENYSKHNPTSWTDITIGDLQKWEELKLSGFQMRVLIALKTYAWDGKKCFPSLESLCERIGLKTETRVNQMCRALKQLEAKGLIKRNKAQAKPDRFVLVRNYTKQTSGTTPNRQHNKPHGNKPTKPHSPLEGATQNEVSFSGKSPQPKKQKKPDRPAVRRKRTRRATKEAYAKLKERIQQDHKEQADCLEAYKQGQQEAPIHFERIFREHQSKTTKDNKRAFFVALVASYFGLCEKPDRPDWFCSGIDLRSPENDRDCMVLYLDYFKLDYFLR